MTKETAGRIAPRKKLRNGCSLWSDSPHRTVRVRGANNIETHDIVIVGAGISGAICALVLSAAGHQVAVLDRRAPGEGSTLASTAMIQFEIDTPLIKLTKQIGRRNAARAYLRSAKAVRDLASLITTYGLEARWSVRDALYLAGDAMGFRALKKEAAARRKIGLPSVFMAAREVREAFGIECTGAILSNGSGELDPAQLSAACLRVAKEMGATIVSPCNVTAIENSDNEVRLQTEGDAIVTGRKVIFATGYEVIGGLPRSAFEIVSSWAFASKPIAPQSFWPTRCLIWEASDPYLYLRSTADNRVLVGGEDSGLTDVQRRAAAIPAKCELLLRKARRLLHLPDLEIDYAWAGAFADSPTGLPVFKQLPNFENVFAILGCGGNGITFSMIAADIVKDWVEGRTDADADLFLGLF